MDNGPDRNSDLSLPSRGRGLKSNTDSLSAKIKEVAPFTGAWIEIGYWTNEKILGGVAPFTGAWIEIVMLYSRSRKRLVAPFTGAWIEITYIRSSAR